MYQLTSTHNYGNGKWYKGMSREKIDAYPSFVEFKKFSQSVADHINKDFPGVAIVKNNCCFVDNRYWEKCRIYVIRNCKTKGRWVK